MDKIIFRNDDVSPNTDLMQLQSLYAVLKELFPDCEIWSCVTLFAKSNPEGSVYAGVPFKDKPIEWFYDVDRILWSTWKIPGKVASHGLLHVDHANVSRQTQEMSILTSCKFLKTDLFVPPFNRINDDTKDICKKNGIKIVMPEEGWKSFEYEYFDPEHKFWYFHSWRWTAEQLKVVLRGKSRLFMDHKK